MCWNKTISLNTFIFSVVVLTLIYMNKNSIYKFENFENKFMYLFLLSISSMQLIEYFLWKSIEEKNNKDNKLYTKLGFILILLQPILSLQLINIKSKKDKDDKNLMLYIYIISIVILLSYKALCNPFKFKTNVSNNHLSWGFMEFKNFEKIFIIIWLITVSFVIYKNKENIIIYILSILILLFTLYKFHKDNTWGSMWCWALNCIFIYYLIQLLFIKPYKQYKNLC